MAEPQSQHPMSAQGEDAAASSNPDAHLEPDPDQIVKVRHDVRPDELPVEGPTDFGRHGLRADPGASEVSVTPDDRSLQEAGPADE